MNPLWLLGGLVAVGGGYYAYTKYQAAQAADPVNQLKSAASGLIASAESAGAGTVENVTKYGKFASPVYDAYRVDRYVASGVVSGAKGVYHDASSVVSTIGGWF